MRKQHKVMIEVVLVILGLATIVGYCVHYQETCERKTMTDFVIKADGKAYLSDVQYCK